MTTDPVKAAALGVLAQIARTHDDPEIRRLAAAVRESVAGETGNAATPTRAPRAERGAAMTEPNAERRVPCLIAGHDAPVEPVPDAVEQRAVPIPCPHCARELRDALHRSVEDLEASMDRERGWKVQAQDAERRAEAAERDRKSQNQLAEARRASRTRPDYDLRCTACGAPHWLDTSIPSGVWNRIAGDDEILCVLCIDARVTAAGLTSECEFYFVGAAITSRGYHESFGELAEARRERDEAREAAEYAIERCTESHIIASLPCERCRPWRAALGRPAPDPLASSRLEDHAAPVSDAARPTVEGDA